MLIVNNNLKIPLEEFEFTYARSGGPGGQNVNKVNSKATLRWDVTNSPNMPETVRERFLAQQANRITNEGELVVSSQRFRDQGRNVADCLEKVREMLADAAITPKKRKPTRPSRGSKERRLQNKRQTSTKKRDRQSPGLDE